MLNCARVSTPSAVPCARGVHLRAEQVEVLVRLVRLRPDVLDEARDEVAVDVLPRACQRADAQARGGRAHLDRVEAEPSRARAELGENPGAPVAQVVRRLRVLVVNVRAH
jgi:hypothetical protein